MRAIAYPLLLLTALPAFAQQAYKCTGPQGQTVFQQAPCAGGQVVNTQPANVLEGNPRGERQVRAQVQREAAVRSHVQAGSVAPGMTEAEMRQAWGLPHTVNTDNVQGRIHRQHVFRHAHGTRYAYTEDGIVTSTQDRPGEGVPARREPCHSEVEIKNAFTAASSITIGETRRQELLRIAEGMKRCRT